MTYLYLGNLKSKVPHGTDRLIILRRFLKTTLVHIKRIGNSRDLQDRRKLCESKLLVDIS